MSQRDPYQILELESMTRTWVRFALGDSSRCFEPKEIMRGANSDSTTARTPALLNEHQRTRLRISSQYIDKLLVAIEDILHSATSQSPFPRYVVDLNPGQIHVLEDYIRRLRSQLVRTIAWQQMKPEPPEIPATRAILANLSFIDIAIEELKPTYMRGSGAVPEDVIDELNGVVHELRALNNGMEHYLRVESTTDLAERLQQLESSGAGVALLRSLEQVVTRNGPVEFRSTISVLASRLEENSFEIALFGRVNCGKSSLLNALLETNVLPVGVNPVTAVPTKLRYGPTLKAALTFGDGRNTAISIEELSRLITEQGNPGNVKNVICAIVEIPSPRLKQRIVLGDTPGLGSLAKRGAAEALAYLPSCDLALLLIDAGTTLSEEDLGTLRLLCKAGIPALVLLSKADLLSSEDLRRSTSYIQESVRCELGLEVMVHPVSTFGSCSAMLGRFFERELLPRFEKARNLQKASVTGKIESLRQAVVAALEASLSRGRTEDEPLDSAELESLLRVVAGKVGEQRSVLDHAFRMFGESPDVVVDLTVQLASLWLVATSENLLSGSRLSEWLHEVVRASIQPPIEVLRDVGHNAIASLEKIAYKVGRSDAPQQEEFDLLLRDLPRFDFAAVPNDISIAHWKLLGESVVLSRIRASLRESIRHELKGKLRLYGESLSQWSDQVVRRLEVLVNSYADAYRAQLQRLSGASINRRDFAQLEADLSLLVHWKSDTSGIEPTMVLPKEK